MAKTLAELIAIAKARKAIQDNQKPETRLQGPESSLPSLPAFAQFEGPITYNSKQLQAIELANQLKSCVIVGAAGTGKTTVLKGIVEALSQHCEVHTLKSHDHKHLPVNVPGIIAVAFTRRAVNNDKKALSDNLSKSCLTIHKTLEFAPVKYSVWDEDGNERQTMRFEPQRIEDNPLPQELKVIIVNEASMVSKELFTLLKNAASPDTVFIFTGDIQQLPPVLGSAILGFKMLELPVIELTEVYRQAFDSPIIRLAHRILSGNGIPKTEIETDFNVPGKLHIYNWKKKFSPDIALATAAKLLTLSDSEAAKVKSIPAHIVDAFRSYNPDEDIILCPFNKALGTIELNKKIAQHITNKKGREVYEVVSGFNTHYFAIGDRILFDKEDARIVSIKPNALYLGKAAKQHSKTLDYWGFEHGNVSADVSNGDTLAHLDQLMESLANSQEDRVAQSSHTLEIYLEDSEQTITTTLASDINSILLGYALTVHKAQGSEWRKVYCIFHNSHATMLQRELLYTAVTRAKEELYIICEDDTFMRGVINQRIKGNTIQEKAEWFKGKYS